MKTVGFLKLINKGNAWSFIILFIRHPLNLIPTFLASYECVKISNDHYGNLHHRNNATNAFRHALWNFLIVKKCSKWRKNKRKAIRWAQKITDWHEEFSPNEPLEKQMDLHNNHIGRKIFIRGDEDSLAEVVELLKQKVKEAKLVNSKKEIKNYHNQLVYIEELS